MPYLFCNIGWMENYEGYIGTKDKLIGGGKFVVANNKGHEVCNFLSCRNTSYGHVESSLGKGKDTQIIIEKLGAIKGSEYVEGVDVVWTATHPTEGRRRVVGWYKNATVYRNRQFFDVVPTKQHKLDGIDNFRITTKTAVLLPQHDRDLEIPKGKGWMGEKAWWYADSGKPEVESFLSIVKDLIEGRPVIQTSADEIQLPNVFEGAKKSIVVNVYERDPRARRACINHWGAKCCVCEFDFQLVYGEIGEGFIHVHHLTPLSKVGKAYKVNPTKDLRPVCPNCHSMIHRDREKILDIADLKKLLKNSGKLGSLIMET